MDLYACTTTLSAMGVSWAKAVPWIGYGVNALATLNDLSSAYGDYQSCMSHP